MSLQWLSSTWYLPVKVALQVEENYNPTFIEGWLVRNFGYEYIYSLCFEERMVLFINDYSYSMANKMIDREVQLIGKELGKNTSEHKKNHKKITSGFMKIEKDFTKPSIIIDESVFEEMQSKKEKALEVSKKVGKLRKLNEVENN